MRRTLYLLLRLVSRSGRLIRRRFTKPGMLVLGALVATATVGVDTDLTLAYQLFSFLFFVLLFAMIQGWSFRPRITIKRKLPTYATAGETFDYRIELRNHGGTTESGLRLLENLWAPLPSFEQFSHGLRRPNDATNFMRRFSIWDKWQRLLAARQPAEIDELSLPKLLPSRPVEIRPRVNPQRRGTINLTGFTIARVDRFGLFKAFVTLPEPDSLLVLPKRYQVPELVLPGNRMYQHGGMTFASSVGESEEFIGLRDYRPGDPLKHIHWKSFARVGVPVVKEHQDEFFERHALVLDTFTDGASLRAFEEAVSVAASFAATIDTQECLLDLLFVGSEVYCFTAGRGQLRTENMLELLAHTDSCEGKSFHELHEAILERRPQLSGCILVLLGYDAARKALVNELRSSGLPIVGLIVSEEQTRARPEPGLHFLEPGRIQEGLARISHQAAPHSG